MIHKTLQRQLSRLGLDTEHAPDQKSWQKFIELVDRTYQGHDDDRYLLERSLKISSNEMQDLYKDLKQSSESMLRGIIDNSPAIIYVKNHQGQFLMVNRKFEQLFNQCRDEIKGKTAHSIVPECYADAMFAIDEAVLKSNQATEFEETIPVNGELRSYISVKFPLRINQGKTHAICCISTDITERRKIEQKLENQTQKLTHEHALLQSLINSIPDLIFYKSPEGRYLGCNKAFEEFSGLPEAELINKTDFDIFPFEAAKTFVDNDQIMLEQNAASRYETWLQYPNNGKKVLVDTLKTPYCGPDTKSLGLIGVSRDITEHKLAEEKLRRAQKMDALGMLTGGIAHDYNNLLGIIMGFADLLVLSLEGKQENLAQYARQIFNAGSRGAKLTSKLLSFSQLTPEEVKLTDINRVLKSNLQMLEKTLTARIQINMELTSYIWPVLIDRSELEDAVLNMSINAMHAMSNGGSLEFITENTTLSEEQASHLNLAEGRYVKFSLSDTGKGMNEDTKSRIFDPFFTTKGENGTGLGLSQVYGFVQRSQGSIHVDSNPGLGTCFSLYFPAQCSVTTHSKNSNREYKQQQKYPSKILIVDDEQALRELAQQILKTAGYKTFLAENGAEALKVLEQQKIDLVFSDVIMPDIDGYELANRITERFHSVKIQLTSGYSEEIQNSHANKLLFRNILKKPFTSMDLLQCVDALLKPNKTPDLEIEQ